MGDLLLYRVIKTERESEREREGLSRAMKTHGGRYARHEDMNTLKIWIHCRILVVIWMREGGRATFHETWSSGHNKDNNKLKRNSWDVWLKADTALQERGQQTYIQIPPLKTWYWWISRGRKSCDPPSQQNSHWLLNTHTHAHAHTEEKTRVIRLWRKGSHI